MNTESDTPTPRTDAYERHYIETGNVSKLINLARDLERELAEVAKQRDHYKAACDQYSEDKMLCKLQEVTKQRDALAEIYPLLASAWFYGEWIAETYNEREIQKIMERQGWWPFESESDLMTALSATEGGCK
jgi:hypothetical protein